MDTMPISVPRQAGIYVRRSREAQGLTRTQLAVAAGVSERLLASLELGDATGIRLDKLLAVFDALGLSLAVQGEKIAATSPSPAPAADRRQTPRPIKAAVTSFDDADLIASYTRLFREIAREQGVVLPEGAS